MPDIGSASRTAFVRIAERTGSTSFDNVKIAGRNKRRQGRRRMAITTTTVTYNKYICPVCGVHYAVDAEFMDRKYIGKGNDNWYCPNGHSLIFTESKADKLAKQLEASRRSELKALEDKRYFESRLSETQTELDITARTLKGSKTRLRNTKARIASGVCPCCNRTFQNVARHMTTKHPHYGKSE